MFSRLDVKKGEAGQPLTHKLRKRTGKSVQEFFVIGKKTASGSAEDPLHWLDGSGALSLRHFPGAV